MQPDIQMKATVCRVARKEISLFFASPIAYLFLATFAIITLFVFFWGEAFFARNIADVRPLFEWMPVLLIFLSSTLTMRLWSEERRTGTLEHVLTQAVPLWHFVLGKFLGCLFLLVIALLITLPLPITVALIGELDWGPVIAGYVATFLIGAAYLSVGLYISARSENQIVSLISASVVCGIFYLVGAATITDFFGTQVGEFLRQLGTGSRFESITRGVIDLRDLYYYFSIMLVFLALNTYILEKDRWAKKGGRKHHRQWQGVTALLIANALCGNLWLGQIQALRLDVTQGKQYSISEATNSYLNQLQEPLLIKGFFSQKTHPLLAPLVPQIRDLLEEYEIAGRGKVRVEFIDPMNDTEQQAEAVQKYGIQPVPFQVADRYQSSVVTSFFDVVVEYGNEYQALGFRDLIEVQQGSATDVDVQLRNPEHDLTRAIKKVLNSYQASGNLFDTIKGNLTFTAYVSADESLPEPLKKFRQSITPILEETRSQSGGRFNVEFINPDENNGQVGQEIAQRFGFKPMAASILSNQRFYFYLTIMGAEQLVQLPLGDLSEANFERDLKAGIKRFAKGFIKTVALVAPDEKFSKFESFISSDLDIAQEDLSDGSVSGQADILYLLAPSELSDKELFAVDQFLMQGGTVVAATSPFMASFENRTLSLQNHTSGLEDWLSHHGLTIDNNLVLDPNNTPFPVPVIRNINGMRIQEMKIIDYPYFVDSRGSGLNQDNLITSELPQATMAWASPIIVDADKQGEREVSHLIKSSNKSWLSKDTNILPRINRQGVSSFRPQGERKSHVLGAVSEGRFESYFAGKESPLLAANETPENTEEGDSSTPTDGQSATISAVIEHSAPSAKIILYSSNDFLNDEILELASVAQRGEYLNTLQMAANSIDWALEDSALLSIRSRGHFNRTLPPMEQDQQMFWEYLNYGLAAFALLAIALIERRSRRVQQRRYANDFVQ